MHAFRSVPLILACLGVTVGADATAAARFIAHSGSQRAVLLELYTSEGCDSCPPADRRLSQFKTAGEFAGRLVPLAFHVDYWDRLGWTDRYASPRYTERQYAMASLARSRQVYTPQFLRNGRDWRSAGSPLDGAGEARPGATIVLELSAPGAGRLAIDGELTLALPTAAADAWLAIYENNLESQVKAGENSGKTLRHDYVVRRLIGPLAPDPAGRVSLRQQIVLDAGWKPADLGIAVFAQKRTSGEILQAVQRSVCAG